VCLQDLLSQKYRTEGELQDLNASIGFSLNMLRSIQTQRAEAEKERNELLKHKVRLHIFVSQFKNNNYVYVRLERFVQEKLNAILKNNIKLLELSLASALTTFKDDPNVYRHLYQKSELTSTQFQKSDSSKSPSTEGISRVYFKNLGKEMIHVQLIEIAGKPRNFIILTPAGEVRPGYQREEG